MSSEPVENPPEEPPQPAPVAVWEASRGLPNNLDFLRLSLAILVIFSHSHPLTLGPSGDGLPEPFVRMTHVQATGGTLAVDGFFILSGFLITQSALNSRGLLEFLSRRIRRIYPGFLACWLFCMFVVGPLAAGHFIHVTRGALFINALRAVSLWEPSFPDAFKDNPIPFAVNGSLWTIKYEVMCYGLMALLYLMGLLRHRLVPLLLFVVCWATMCGLYLGVIHVPVEEGIFGYLLVGRLDEWLRLGACYLAGAAFVLWRDRIPFSRGLGIAAAVALVAACFLPPLLRCLLPVAGTYALLFAGFSPVKPLTLAAKRGDFSYGVYLYAFPVQQLLQHFLPTLTAPMQFALALLPTFALAFLSWHLVEKWFLKSRQRTGA